MDKSALDALNQEMFQLTLRHYQSPLQQDIIVPSLPSITASAPPPSNNHFASGGQPPQKDRNNNLLADYQFNHIFSSAGGNPTSIQIGMSTQSSTGDYNSTKDLINQRMSGHSSLARATAFTGFGGIPK